MLSLGLILLFWPAILVSLLVSGFGIMQGRVGWLFLGALLSLPFSLYLAASPGFGWTSLSLPFCHLLGWLAVRWKYRWLAGIFLVPFAGFFSWLAFTVLLQ